MALVRRRGAIQTKNFTKKRQKKMIFAGVLFVVAAASIITAFFFFFKASFVTIQSVEVSGPVGVNGGALSIVSADTVKSEIEKKLADNSLGIFSDNNLFLYPKNSIDEQLMKDFPAIGSIDFRPENSFFGFGSHIVLHVFITERAPFALACPPGQNSSAECFYMDSSGFVYAPAPQFSSGIYIRYRQSPPSASSTPIAPGKFIVDPAVFVAAKQIVAAVSSNGLNIVGDDIGFDAYGADNMLSAIIASSTASSTNPVITNVYFNQSESTTTALRYFSEFWQNQGVQKENGKQVEFQYIDMRYGKDIVYKLYK
jgi:hypothetical protein